MRQSKLQFIQGFTDAQRLATQQALVMSFQEGGGTAATARAFRDSIGLSQRQVVAVDRYRKLLESGDKAALTRALRDRRFDRTVVNTFNNDKKLTTKQIDTMVDRFREKHLKSRAETIARTEAVRATSIARDEALRQTLESTGIPAKNVRRTWVATLDDMVRENHSSMNGQPVGLDETFTDGNGNSLRFPGDPSAPADTVINCRCAITTKIKPSK